MSRARVPRKKRSSWRLRATQRLRRSWTHWLLTKTQSRVQKAETLLLLLRLETDSQLLRLKELSQLQEILQHRELEMQESLQYQSQLLQPQPPPTGLQSLLGSGPLMRPPLELTGDESSRG